MHKSENDVHECPRLPEVAAYVLGELTVEEKREMDGHLKTCAVCSHAMAGFAGVVGKLKSLPSEKMSGDLTDKVMARLPPDAWSERTPSSAIPFWAKAAAILILSALTGIAFLWHGKSKPEPIAQTIPLKSIVLKTAMDWLKVSQASDGGWGSAQWGTHSSYAVGVSALALIAMMDQDADALRGSNGEVIRKGIEYLIAQQDESGLIGLKFSGSVYNQGLAVLALLEATALESNQVWKSAADQAIVFLCRVQTEPGGWGYLRTGQDAPNTSATIWPLLALARAESMGYSDLHPRIDQAMSWLKSNINEKGFVGYSRANDFPYGRDTLTAAGAVCLLLQGRDQHLGEARNMLNAIEHMAEREEATFDFYGIYFRSKAYQLAGKRDLEIASTKKLDDINDGYIELALLQKTTGPESGSWDAVDQWGRVGGRVYATAMATLAMKCGG